MAYLNFHYYFDTFTVFSNIIIIIILIFPIVNRNWGHRRCISFDWNEYILMKR